MGIDKAGYFFGKGDHIPATRSGWPSLANALTLVPSWETWFIRRPSQVHPSLVLNPEEWDVDTNCTEDLHQPTFPVGKSIPSTAARRENTVIGLLDPDKGNLWKVIYDTIGPMLITKAFKTLTHQQSATPGTSIWKI